MNIVINNKEVEVRKGETLIEVARREGFFVPSLCYSKDAKHKSSCMVCAVKDCKSGQIIPSCTTLPVEGMQIDTESAEVVQTRAISLELLLSDHRADCEAPCSLVCPERLDIERMLEYYDTRQWLKAREEIAKAFSLPELACDTCKAPCEKACRRGTIDESVAIRSIIKEIVQTVEQPASDKREPLQPLDKSLFLSRLGRFTPEEKEILKSTVTSPSRCLHCACAGKTDCKLRTYATSAGIKRSRYETSSTLHAMTKQPVAGNIWFEPVKCIRCGLCVYNSADGFTFKDRGFVMQVVLPEENARNINESLTELCPTGALYMK